MTEYGRSPGSEPWHPEDPLYGDGGWEGQQAPMGQQPAYGGQPQHHHYPQQQQPQQPNYGDWGQGQAQQYDQQQYGEQQYPQSYDQQQYAHQGQQQGQQQGYHEGYHEGGWDGTGTHAHVPYAADPGDPYGQQAAAYGAEQPDFYGTPDAYPPPEPPARRHPEAAPEPEAEPEQKPDWDPGPEEQEEHPFFAGGGADTDDEDDEADGRGARGDRRGRGGKGAKGGKGPQGKKSRNGCACLVVALVFVGGLGGVAYFGYQFYQARFASAPDFAGNGTTETVAVVIPDGALGAEIGRRLKEAGVVKSVDAFVSAQQQTPSGDKIQAGAYILKKEMSAKAAVEMMLDGESQANVLVKPGQRNAEVYKAIDEKLALSFGTTKKVAEEEYKTLGLPRWANNNSDIKDPLEGFLFPGTYPAAAGMKPQVVLKEMVTRAAKAYASYDLEAKAEKFKLDDPLQVVTVASLVQAEGKTVDDYRKMAEVIYNRLDRANPETYGFLQFDSTFNYLKSESKINISESEITSNKDPYNTYTNKGLPPGPIGNPGEVAMKSALDPTGDGWYYFVATDGVSKTEFAKTHEDFLKLKDKFNESTGN